LKKNCWLFDFSDRFCDSLITEISEQLINIAGDRNRLKIIILESNPVLFIAAFLASLNNNNQIFLANPNWKENEWNEVLTLVRPDIILGDRDRQINLKSNLKIVSTDLILDRDLVKSKLGRGLALPNLYKIYVANSSPESSLCNSVLDRSPELSIPLIMIPTGGSSGKIRFTIHTWETLTASVKGFQKYFELKNVNSFCVLPLYHVSGLMQFMRSLITNGKLAIADYKYIKEGKKISEINPEEFFISLVPTQLQFLIETDPNWLASFQTVLLGGSPAWRSLLDNARKHRIRLAPTYGMTETASQVATLKPEDFLAGNNSSGKVLPHGAIELDTKNNDRQGIITVKASSLCLGYYPNLFSDRESFQTDDIGFFDRDGFLHIVGRNSQKIITGGENVFPAEIEAAILATGSIDDVCVVGIPDPKWGEVTVAVYVAEKDNLNSVKQKLDRQLSKYKQPKYWLKCDRLSRNAQGKIDRQQTIDLAMELIEKSNSLGKTSENK
jgi:o-succinylbenzoate---CoA ligase